MFAALDLRSYQSFRGQRAAVRAAIPYSRIRLGGPNNFRKEAEPEEVLYELLALIGITKLAGYSRCLSVIASTIPRSRKTALATIFAPIVLGTDATAILPSSVLHLKFKLSSLRRIMGEPGISAWIDIRLLVIWQEPLLPSLKEIAIGTKASLVMDAQPATKVAERIIIIFLKVIPPVSVYLINLTLCGMEYNQDLNQRHYVRSFF